MKKICNILVLVVSVFMLFNSFGKLYATSIDEDMNKAIYSALGDAVAQVIEEKAGVPASAAGTITGYFSAGDFKDGLLEIIKLASDTAISAIPVIGPLKFAVSLESSLIKVWKSWLDWTEISYAWDIFKQLSPTDQKQWLDGEEIPELDYSKAAMYLERNGYNIRQLFRKYYDAKVAADKYLEAIKQISEILEDAKYLVEPDLYTPAKSGEKIKLNSKIEIWRSGNNYFKIMITLPDGKTSSIIKKFSDTKSTFSFKLTDFSDIDWNKYFEKYPDGINVNFNVYAAIWDNTGLIEKVMGSDYVTPKEKILRNIPGQDKQIVNLKFSAIVISDILQQKLLVSVDGPLYFKYSISVTGAGSQSGSDSISLSDTFNIVCKNQGDSYATDDDGLKWNATCNFETGNDGNSYVRSVTLSIAFSGLTVYSKIYFNDGGTCSCSISSSGTYNMSSSIVGDDGNTYTYTATVYDLKSNPSCHVH